MVGHNLECCWNWNIVEYSKFWLFLKLLHNYNITTIEKTGTPGLLFVHDKQSKYGYYSLKLIAFTPDSL